MCRSRYVDSQMGLEPSSRNFMQYTIRVLNPLTVNLLHQFDWIKNHLGDILLDMSVNMFSEEWRTQYVKLSLKVDDISWLEFNTK